MTCLKRTISLLTAAGLLMAAEAAEAAEYGGWYARVTLDGWHDDNLARRLTPSADRFPRGNQDVGGDVGLALGSVFLLAPRLDLWVTASARHARPLLYPEWSGGSASLYADLGWRWDAATQAYAALGGSRGMLGGPFYSAEVGIDRRLWPGGSGHMGCGVGHYTSDRPDRSFSMPGVSMGLRHTFAGGTRLAGSYGFQQRYHSAGAESQHQLFFLAAQRLSPLFELRARYTLTAVGAEPEAYRNGFFNLGLVFEL